jgi:hypothetical protein
MNKKYLPLCLAALLATSSVQAGDKEVSLISLMGHFQYFMHKTALSLDARNMDLVKFYAHEIEENLEIAEEYGKYKDFHIGTMVKQTLTPEFEKFEEFVDNKDLDKANAQFDKMVDSCNRCHQSSQNGFLVIKRVNSNPYMQSFKPE